MPPPINPFTDEELQIITTDYFTWGALGALTDKLNGLSSNEKRKRTTYSVTMCIRSLGLKRRPSEKQRRHLDKIHAIRSRSMSQQSAFAHSDLRFKTAMIQAVNCGAEKAIFGTVKDHRPFSVGNVHAEPNFSIAGSSAAMCVND